MKRIKALVLAAGMGMRLRPITSHIAKCLVPLAGRPLLDWWMDGLIEAGVSDALINTHWLPEQVRRYITRVNASGAIRLHETYEPKLLGSAGTLAANRPLADHTDEVLIIYADNLSDVDLGAMLRFHRSHPDPVTMLLFRASDPGACGIAELDDRQHIVSFQEKPREPKSNLANAGVYIVDADAYRQMADMGALDIGFEVLPKFVGRMRGWVASGYHLDIGTLSNYEKGKADAPGLLAKRVTHDTGARPAVFLDRDGTLIEHVHYLCDPAKVRLATGAASMLLRLREAGYACVVASNQSGVGRGLMTEEQVVACNEEMSRQLADAGTAVDGIYYCTAVPDSDDRTRMDHFERKPGPGMVWKAALDMGLDLSRSWIIGDMVSDAVTARNAQCKGAILVGSSEMTLPAEMHDDLDCLAARDLEAAADIILASPPAITMRRRG